MDIFTDASLNDNKKISGVGCVFVDTQKGVVTERSSFFSNNSIHIAELCALMFAVQAVGKSDLSDVRIVSDSTSALNKLHYYISCKKTKPYKLNKEQLRFLHNLNRSDIQSVLLDEMFKVFVSSSVRFTFAYVPGHQKHPPVNSDCYWNDRADKAAQNGRLLGEVSQKNGILHSIADVCDFSDNADNGWGGGMSEQVLANVRTIFVEPHPKKVKVKLIEHHKGRQKDGDCHHIKINTTIHFYANMKTR